MSQGHMTIAKCDDGLLHTFKDENKLDKAVCGRATTPEGTAPKDDDNMCGGCADALLAWAKGDSN